MAVRSWSHLDKQAVWVIRIGHDGVLSRILCQRKYGTPLKRMLETQCVARFMN